MTSFVESATLRVIDRSTAPINKINAALRRLQATAKSMKSVNIAGGNTAGLRSMSAAIRRVTSDMTRMNSALRSMGRGGSPFPGRDHHPRAFTIWMAGGGVKAGLSLGQTDELGYNVVEDPVDVHDLHATILHLMGLDHTKVTYRSQGRNFRLTDVFGNVVTKLVA